MLTLAGNPSRDPGRREGHSDRLASRLGSTLKPGGRRADVVGVDAQVGGADPQRGLWRGSNVVLAEGGERSDSASPYGFRGRTRWGSPEILPEAKKNASVRTLTAMPPASGLHSCPCAAATASSAPPRSPAPPKTASSTSSRCILLAAPQLIFPRPRSSALSWCSRRVIFIFMLMRLIIPIDHLLLGAPLNKRRHLLAEAPYPSWGGVRPKWKICVVLERPR